MPSIIDILEYLNFPINLIKLIGIVFLIFLVVKFISSSFKKYKCLEITVVEDIALIFRSPKLKSHPHALFKLKVQNLSDQPITISSISFESKGSLYNKSTPLEHPRDVFIGIYIDEYGMIKKDGGSIEIRVTDQFQNDLYLLPGEASTKFIYFYNFLKVEKNNYVTLVFDVGNRSIKKKVLIREGVNPNAYLQDSSRL